MTLKHNIIMFACAVTLTSCGQSQQVGNPDKRQGDQGIASSAVSQNEQCFSNSPGSQQDVPQHALSGTRPLLATPQDMDAGQVTHEGTSGQDHQQDHQQDHNEGGHPGAGEGSSLGDPSDGPRGPSFGVPFPHAGGPGGEPHFGGPGGSTPDGSEADGQHHGGIQPGRGLDQVAGTHPEGAPPQSQQAPSNTAPKNCAPTVQGETKTTMSHIPSHHGGGRQAAY